ncbi:hypothetical protein [Polaromonas naphthalenivorans]|uniref:Uncharacterized protein n=1 Tax=Polaromonas naphthalenivorans (strain CJ2) TaxID=365044 RepID=A1VPH3_POLNA|nr:hypothetical protein [Polaromonas naphthalenivorans]ABM37551.1 conserved hypothetical protein [Polaromonas naphthalenivorans CJ2]
MTTPLSLIARKGQMAGLRAALDAGGGKALFYINAPPATPDDATAETLLGSINLATPSGALGDASGLATLTLTVPQITNALASGIIGWVRLADGAGHGFMDLPAGLAGSGLPVILNALQVYTGGEIQLLACLIAA